MTEPHSLMSTTERPAPIMVRGSGSYLWDDRGRRYLDWIQGWAVNALGHCAPEVHAAISAQLAELVAPSPAYHNLPQLRLAQALTERSGFARAVFVSSGAEANETAIKLARKWGRVHKRAAFKIVTTRDSFHGRTLTTMAASGKPGWETLFPPHTPGFVKVPYGDLDAAARAVDSETVAVMLEPVQGEAGVRLPPAGYLQGLRALTRQHELLLIFDEVQTGIGRTGRLFAKDYFGVEPDVMTLGKALGGGLPLSAVLTQAHVDPFVPGEHGSTFGGNPLCTGAGLAVLETVSKGDFLARVRLRGEELARGLSQLARQFDCLEARGVGLLCALELQQPLAHQVRDAAFERGLLLNAAQPKVLRFAPSLRISPQEIAEGLGLLAASLSSVLGAGARDATLLPGAGG